MPDWYQVTDPNCPVEDSDAGDSRPWAEEQQRREIQAYRRHARREFDAAKHWLNMNHEKAEEHARSALDLGAKAYWLAELTDLAEREYRTLHAMGRWTTINIGCSLSFQDGQYSRRCPVSIAELRLGLSPAFAARKMCSICDTDLSECHHRRSRLYWVRGTRTADGRCRVCAMESCKHRDDRVYRTGVIGVVKEVEDFPEVSFVDVPAQPFARLVERPVDLEQLAAHLGPSFAPGVRVRCENCLGPYEGLPAALDADAFIPITDLQ